MQQYKDSISSIGKSVNTTPKILSLLILSFFLTGCTLLEELKDLRFKQQFEINPPTENESLNNASNNISVNTKKILFYNESLTNIIIPSSNSILVIEKNSSFIVDIPKENPLIISYLNEFGIKELNSIFVTINKEEHNGGVQYVVVKTPPKRIYDNGIENEYRSVYILRLDRYNSYWNKTPSDYITVLTDLSVGNFKLFVPYTRGLSNIKEENSIVVLYGNKLLYMSDCYDNCEKKLPPLTAEYLILANNGVCPTTSFDFILSVGARYIIGDEICPSLKLETDMMGIKSLSINQVGTIQLLINNQIEGKDELKTEL